MVHVCTIMHVHVHAQAVEDVELLEEAGAAPGPPALCRSLYPLSPLQPPLPDPPSGRMAGVQQPCPASLPLPGYQCRRSLETEGGKSWSTLWRAWALPGVCPGCSGSSSWFSAPWSPSSSTGSRLAPPASIPVTSLAQHISFF